MFLTRIFQVFIMVVGTLGANEKVTYLSVERPTISYCNTKYLNGSCSARRYSRSDPVHYFNINVTTYTWFDNNFTMHYYFYEFLTNTYKRGFVEMHFGLCDLLQKDKFFGSTMAQGRLAGPCPYPPGNYYLTNMTIPTTSIPKGFPFSKGRIYCNMTSGSTGEFVLSGHIDMELMQLKKKKN